ncbi:MAG: hypothetical protein ACRDUA_19160, partial [Micromonosporaceae bacterium]
MTVPASRSTWAARGGPDARRAGPERLRRVIAAQRALAGATGDADSVRSLLAESVLSVFDAEGA